MGDASAHYTKYSTLKPPLISPVSSSACGSCASKKTIDKKAYRQSLRRRMTNASYTPVP